MVDQRELSFAEELSKSQPLRFNQLLADREEWVGSFTNLPINRFEGFTCAAFGVGGQNRRGVSKVAIVPDLGLAEELLLGRNLEGSQQLKIGHLCEVRAIG